MPKKKCKVKKAGNSVRLAEPRVIQDLTGHKIVEWYVLLVRKDGGVFEARMMHPRRAFVAGAWRKLCRDNPRYIADARVRPCRVLVGPLLEYARPLSDRLPVSAGTEIRDGYYEMGFPQLAWETY